MTFSGKLFLSFPLPFCPAHPVPVAAAAARVAAAGAGRAAGAPWAPWPWLRAVAGGARRGRAGRRGRPPRASRRSRSRSRGPARGPVRAPSGQWSPGRGAGRTLAAPWAPWPWSASCRLWRSATAGLWASSRALYDAYLRGPRQQRRIWRVKGYEMCLCWRADCRYALVAGRRA